LRKFEIILSPLNENKTTLNTKVRRQRKKFRLHCGYHGGFTASGSLRVTGISVFSVKAWYGLEYKKVVVREKVLVILCQCFTFLFFLRTAITNWTITRAIRHWKY